MKFNFLKLLAEISKIVLINKLRKYRVFAYALSIQQFVRELFLKSKKKLKLKINPGYFRKTFDYFGLFEPN